MLSRTVFVDEYKSQSMKIKDRGSFCNWPHKGTVSSKYPSITSTWGLLNTGFCSWESSKAPLGKPSFQSSGRPLKLSNKNSLSCRSRSPSTTCWRRLGWPMTIRARDDRRTQSVTPTSPWGWWRAWASTSSPPTSARQSRWLRTTTVTFGTETLTWFQRSPRPRSPINPAPRSTFCLIDTRWAVSITA